MNPVNTETLFETQIAAQHRTFAIAAGERLLAAYRASGAYDALLTLLLDSTTPVRFEFGVSKTVGGVPLYGVPDGSFSADWLEVILDWKVKGYMSAASPSKGFLICRDGFEGKPSKRNGLAHPGCTLTELAGLPISVCGLEQTNPEYAAQCTIYHWLNGAEPGNEDWLAQIEELVSNKKGQIRVATHRARVGREFQLKLLRQAQECWEAITSGHIFQDVSRAESDDRCARLLRSLNPQVPSQATQLASLEACHALAG